MRKLFGRGNDSEEEMIQKKKKSNDPDQRE